MLTPRFVRFWPFAIPIAFLGCVVLTLWPQRLDGPKIDVTKYRMREFVAAIEEFRARNGRLPSAMAELCRSADQAGFEPRTEAPVDPWGNPIALIRWNATEVDLVSLGADGVEGGEDDDADIVVSYRRP